MAYRRAEQDARSADRLRKPLQAEENSKQRNEALEEINDRQPARLARAFHDGPGARGIGNRQQRQHDGEGNEKDERAAEIDQRPRARLRLRVEDIDADVAADLQRPGGREHEQRRVRVKNGFLQADPADAERIAHHHHGEFGEHDEDAAPRRRPADGRSDAVDAVGEKHGRWRHE